MAFMLRSRWASMVNMVGQWICWIMFQNTRWIFSYPAQSSSTLRLFFCSRWYRPVHTKQRLDKYDRAFQTGPPRLASRVFHQFAKPGVPHSDLLASIREQQEKILFGRFHFQQQLIYDQGQCKYLKGRLQWIEKVGEPPAMILGDGNPFDLISSRIFSINEKAASQFFFRRFQSRSRICPS